MPGTPPKPIAGDLPPAKVAASSAWKSPNTFELTLRYYETPHRDMVTCHFDGDSVQVKFMNSVTEKGARVSRNTPRPACAFVNRTLRAEDGFPDQGFSIMSKCC